jgi:cell division septal protein FtsQ
VIFLDKTYFNEYDESQVKKLYKKRKKKKLKKRFKVLIILCLLFIIIGYFISGLSRVKKITVIGNHDVSTDSIIETSDLDKNTIYILINKSKVEKNIKNLPFIKKANVSYDVFGNVTIEIEESQQVAYCVINKKTYVLDEYGSVIETKDETVKDKLKSCPKLSSFKTLKFLKTFAKEYAKVPELIKSQTSDIIYSPENADETRVRFVLDNGKELIVRVEDMAEELNDFAFAAYMNEHKDVCTFNFYGKNIYLEKCEDE